MEWNLLDKEQEFLDALKLQGKSFNTLKNYKADLNCFNNFLLDRQETLQLGAFTSTQVQEYSQHLDTKYDSPNSVRRRVQALRLFFDFLMLKGLFPENPLKKMAVSPKVLDAPEPTPFSEVVKTYELLKKKFSDSQGLPQLVNLRNIIVFHLIYGAGLKVSDISGLQRKSILKDKKGYRVMVEHPKRDPYSVPMPTIFENDFIQYCDLLDQELKNQDLEIHELLFNANPYRILSGGLSPRGTELFFEDIRKEIKSKMTAKSLRQSCIFKWINLNINHTTIKEWLGVSPSYSLDLYTEEFNKDSTGKVFKDLGQEHA